MTAEIAGAECNWLCTGREVFPAMLEAIAEARHSVLLETYIFAPGPFGERFRDALIHARQRGVRVQVLVDGLGSYALPAHFWDGVKAAGGEVRVFNPIALRRLGIRNHRKLLVCDRQVAFVGGFNLAPEYDGDGVTCGWCDVGLRIDGVLAEQLAVSFEDMFSRADFQHKRFVRLRKSKANRVIVSPQEQVLLSGPGRGNSPIKRALRQDLAQARSVRVIAAYFLPPWRLRRQLAGVVRRGGEVHLILPAKSDVLVSRLAAQSLYPRLLRAGIRLFEYQPQVLHAKLILIDEMVYIGSANLDQRSLNINYELMVRFHTPPMAAQAREVFDNTLAHCREIELETWKERHSLWERLKQHWSYFLLVRLDPYIARYQWRWLPD